MLKRILLSLAVFMSSACLSQTPNWEWAQGHCTGVGTNYWANLATDVAGNTYFTAPFNQSSVIFGTDTLYHVKQGDFFLVKYDSACQVKWARAFGGMRVDVSRGVAVDKACNVYVCGMYQSTALTLDNITLTNPDTIGSVYLIKFDSSGNVLWARNGGGANLDIGMSVACDNTGQVYLSGSTESPTFTMGSVSLNMTGGSKFFTSRFDSSGNVIWIRTALCVGGSGSDTPHDLAADSGGAYITGYFKCQSLDWGDTILYNSDNTFSRFDIFLVRYDTSGNVLWAKAYGSASGGDLATAVEIDGYGNLYLAGAWNSTAQLTLDNIVLNNTLASSGDMFLAKCRSDGSVIWARNSTGVSWEGATSIAVKANGDLFMTGAFEGPTTFGTVQAVHTSATYSSNTSSDVFVVKYDSAGTAGWVRSVNGIEYQSAAGISVDNGYNVYVTGYYLGLDSANFGPLHLKELGSCNTHTYIAKLGVFGTTDLSVFSSAGGLRAYPNPAESKLTLNGYETLGAVNIYNTMGDLVFESHASSNELVIDIGNYPAGLYILRSAAGVVRIVKQ